MSTLSVCVQSPDDSHTYEREMIAFLKKKNIYIFHAQPVSAAKLVKKWTVHST